MSLFNVGFVIFPDLTQLDFTGPQQVLARLPDSAMHIVAKTKDAGPSGDQEPAAPATNDGSPTPEELSAALTLIKSHLTRK